MSEKTLYFCDADGDTIVVIRKIKSHWSKQDVFDLYHDLPIEISDQIAFVDAVERVMFTDETENIRN